VCTGFCTVAFVPSLSPNDQFQLVGVFVEVSVNFTVRGTVPVVDVAVKPATGAGAPTVMYPAFRVLLYPPMLYAWSATE
jgi:hypothetical protein